MNRLSAFLITALLGFGANSCGDVNGKVTRSRSSANATAAAGSLGGATTENTKRDRDKDRDDPAGGYYDEDDNAVLRFGRAASTTEDRMIRTVVRRYFVAAAATDGAKACRLIFSALAEAIPDIDGHSSLSPALHGNTCAVVMSKLFKQSRSTLADDLANLRVTSTRVEGDRGFALLNLGPSAPASVMRMHREGRAWKIGGRLPSVLL